MFEVKNVIQSFELKAFTMINSKKEFDSGLTLGNGTVTCE